MHRVGRGTTQTPLTWPSCNLYPGRIESLRAVMSTASISWPMGCVVVSEKSIVKQNVTSAPMRSGFDLIGVQVPWGLDLKIEAVKPKE